MHGSRSASTLPTGCRRSFRHRAVDGLGRGGRRRAAGPVRALVAANAAQQRRRGRGRQAGSSFVKTAGPAHLSFSDRGVTFATNGDRAVCVRFHQPVRALDPTGLIQHPGATFTVADPPALIAALEAR